MIGLWREQILQYLNAETKLKVTEWWRQGMIIIKWCYKIMYIISIRIQGFILILTWEIVKLPVSGQTSHLASWTWIILTMRYVTFEVMLQCIMMSYHFYTVNVIYWKNILNLQNSTVLTVSYLTTMNVVKTEVGWDHDNFQLVMITTDVTLT